MNEKNGIHILGGGPSGLAAAIALARAGKETYVHERYEIAGKRFQGDLQGLENWSQKQDVLEQFQSFGIKTDFSYTPFKEVHFSDGRFTFRKEFKKPLFYLVKRGTDADSLDSSLTRQALECGVNMRYRSQIAESDAHIIATGPIRSALIASDRGIVFRTDLPNIAVGFFHDDIAYLGYSYLLIANGYGCLCSVVFKDFHRLNHCFDETVRLAKKLYPLLLDEAHPVGGVGSFSLHHPKQKDNSLLVGEAGGMQDLLWGFGIRFAITSGYLASQAIIKGKEYPNSIEKAVTPFLKASIVNRYIWEKWKIFSRPLLPFFLSIPFAKRAVYLLYRYTFLHRMLFPIAKRYVNKHYPNSI